jgi:hypothetical protein
LCGLATALYQMTGPAAAAAEKPAATERAAA